MLYHYPLSRRPFDRDKLLLLSAVGNQMCLAADQTKTIFEEYLKVVNILAMLGVPISIFVFFSSNEIVYLVLGSKWMEVPLSYKYLAPPSGFNW